MCDLMVLAFQTDSTRASSFMVTKEATDRNYPWLGFTDGHHELSHHAGDAEKNRKLREIDRYHISILGYMIEKMMTVEEADGTTLLDNSMVLYGSGISDGDRHDHVNLPVIVVGKGRRHPADRAAPEVPAGDADVQPAAGHAASRRASRSIASATAPSRCRACWPECDSRPYHLRDFQCTRGERATAVWIRTLIGAFVILTVTGRSGALRGARRASREQS